jgi:hypothetical protein
VPSSFCRIKHVCVCIVHWPSGLNMYKCRQASCFFHHACPSIIVICSIHAMPIAMQQPSPAVLVIHAARRYAIPFDHDISYSLFKHYVSYSFYVMLPLFIVGTSPSAQRTAAVAAASWEPSCACCTTYRGWEVAASLASGA